MERNRPTATATDDPLDVSDIKLQEISFDNSFSFDSDGSSDEFENSMSNTMSVGLPSSENIGYPIAAGAFTSTPKKGGYADVYEFSDDQNAGDSGIASISTVTSSLNNMSFDTSSESASDGENNLLHELPSGSSDSDTSTEHEKSMKAVERVEGIIKSQKCSTPAHLSKKLDNETVLINKKLCCQKKCLEHLSKGEVKNARLSYWSKKPDQRKEWLYEKFLQATCSSKKHMLLGDKGNAICYKAFSLTYGICRSTLFMVKKKFQSGCFMSSPKKKKSVLTESGVQALLWLEKYASSHGDRMPDKEEVRLPYGSTKKNIYSEYLDNQTRSERLEPSLGPSRFYEIWRDHMPFLKIKKVRWSMFQS